ncbi:hypothetical protein GCM10010240_10940 [Streptomyces griseoviridis]|nr:hypothetical protein GCM10010240_10940 [Streptomyces griseoviridis]
MTVPERIGTVSNRTRANGWLRRARTGTGVVGLSAVVLVPAGAPRPGRCAGGATDGRSVKRLESDVGDAARARRGTRCVGPGPERAG